MAGFGGFSEAEIRRFKAQGQVDLHEENNKRDVVKKATLNNASKRGKPREKVRHKHSRPNKVDTSTSPSLKKPQGEAAQAENKVVEEKVVDDKKTVEKEREVEVIMEPERIKEIEMSNLEKMQQKQKEMEKVNKQKEKMLQYTLKERYQKTKIETETLKMVQRELSHLDNLLHTDIGLLREKIDEACKEYDLAKKRFGKAESEYINAKINLHSTSEKKDQLTEHLYSIIQENEQRKARKLAELMSKLEIADQNVNNLESFCVDEPKVVKQDTIIVDSASAKGLEGDEKMKTLDKNISQQTGSKALNIDDKPPNDADVKSSPACIDNTPQHIDQTSPHTEQKPSQGDAKLQQSNQTAPQVGEQLTNHLEQSSVSSGADEAAEKVSENQRVSVPLDKNANGRIPEIR